MGAVATIVCLLYFGVLVCLAQSAARLVGAFERIASATERAADAHAPK